MLVKSDMDMDVVGVEISANLSILIPPYLHMFRLRPSKIYTNF